MKLLTDDQRSRYYSLKKTADKRSPKEDREYKDLKKLRLQEKAAETATPAAPGSKVLKPAAPTLITPALGASATDDLSANIQATRALLAQQKATVRKRSALDDLIDPEQWVADLARTGMDLDALEDDLGDMPRAANVIEFCFDARFLAYTAYAWQMKVAVELFAEWCTNCSDRQWLADLGPSGDVDHLPLDATLQTFLSKVQLYQFGVCPVCKGKRNDQHGADNLPYEMLACVGQRSGKSILAGGIIANYILHRYLVMRNPSRAYNVVPGQPVYMTFTARTLGQAMETLWDAFSSAHVRAPWFMQYHDMLRARAADKGIDPDLLFAVKNTYVWYGTKMITVKCEAPDGGTMRGRTRIGSFIDELAFFGSGDTKKANGPEVYAALKNALYTVRTAADKLAVHDPNTLQGIMVNVSSPTSVYDPLMTLLRESQKDERVVRLHKATWEVNPNYTRASLRGEEAKNYATFMRDFGAVPPLSDSPFLDNVSLIDRCVMDGQQGRTKFTPHIRTTPTIVTDAMGSRYVGVKLDSFQASPFPYVIALDAGEVGNHFAVGLYHMEPGDEATQDYVRVAGLVDLAPHPDPANGDTMRIHFESVFNLVTEICAKARVVAVLMDRWQSTAFAQRLRDLKINAEQVSTVGAHLQAVRSRVNAGGLRIPCVEKTNVHELQPENGIDLQLYPYAHFVLQLKTVREIGIKVTKPLKGEDDMFRTFVLANAYMEKHREKFLVAYNPNAKSNDSKALGSVYLPGGGRRGGGSPDPSLGVVRSRRLG